MNKITVKNHFKKVSEGDIIKLYQDEIDIDVKNIENTKYEIVVFVENGEPKKAFKIERTQIAIGFRSALADPVWSLNIQLGNSC